MPKPSILIRALILFIAVSYLWAAAGWAQGFKDAHGALEFFSASQFGVPPFADDETIGTPQPSSKPLLLLRLGENALTLKTQYVEKQAENGLTGVPLQGRTQGQVKAVATSSLVDRLLTAEWELAYSSFDSKSLEGLTEQSRRLLRFGLKGGWADFAYGAEYRSTGKDFINLSGPGIAGDQEGGELWAQQKFGMLSLKASLSDFTNNVAQDPTLPRISKIQGNASFSLAPPSWPVLSLFYSKSSLASSNEPAGFNSQRGSVDFAGASLAYKAPQWDTTLSSTYSLNNTTTRWREENTFPTSSAGSFHFASSQVQTNTPVLSLGLNYRPGIVPVQVSSSGSYTRTTTSDGYTNNNAFNLSTLLTWTLGESTAGKNTLALSASFKRYTDNIDPGGSNKHLSVWLRLKISAF